MADAKLSLNINGAYEGGGVCLGCSDNTGGINCQSCIDGYYRPSGVSFLLILSEKLFGPHCPHATSKSKGKKVKIDHLLSSTSLL